MSKPIQQAKMQTKKTKTSLSDKDCPFCKKLLTRRSAESPVIYCASCQRMFDMHGESLNYQGGYYYNFATSGRFELLDKERPLSDKGKAPHPACRETLRLCEKLFSHLVWIGVWMIAFRFFPEKLSPLFLSLVIVSFFFFGCHLTTLFLYGQLKALLFPPDWEQVIRQLATKPDIALLSRYGLDCHPGFLTNLALSLERLGHQSQAEHFLQQANALCASHPYLQALNKKTG